MATLKEIARKVGVDISTVSYVLNGKAAKMGIGAARVKQIQEAATRLNYRPNSAARNLKRGRFGSVALILHPDWKLGHLPGRLLGEIQARLEEWDLILQISRLPDDRLTDANFVPRILGELCTDGLLIGHNERVSPRMTELIETHVAPAVWINFSGTRNAVAPADYDAARQMAARLYELGHRRIAFAHHAWSSADESLGHYSLRDRRVGVESFLTESGLVPIQGPIRLPNESDNYDELLKACVRCLSAPNRPTAIIDYAGQAEGIFAAAQQLGMRIPQDLSLMAFGNTAERHFGRVVSTALIPLAEMGTAAVDLLVKIIFKSVKSQPAKSIPFTFEPGETCAPPPSFG